MPLPLTEVLRPARGPRRLNLSPSRAGRRRGLGRQHRWHKALSKIISHSLEDDRPSAAVVDAGQFYNVSSNIYRRLLNRILPASISVT